LKQARAFYALILLSTVVGVGLDFIGINPVKALYWTAVLNGLLAPFLLVAILVVASDRELMQDQPSFRLGWTVLAITTVAMFAGRSHVGCIACRSRCRRTVRSPVSAKLIVELCSLDRTRQPSQGYACTHRAYE